MTHEYDVEGKIEGIALGVSDGTHFFNCKYILCKKLKLHLIWEDLFLIVNYSVTHLSPIILYGLK